MSSARKPERQNSPILGLFFIGELVILKSKGYNQSYKALIIKI
jgi:hypothetical protein